MNHSQHQQVKETESFEGKVVDLKDDPHNSANTVLVVEKKDGTHEEVLLTPFQVRRLLQE